MGSTPIPRIGSVFPYLFPVSSDGSALVGGVLIGLYRIHSCMTLIKKHRVRTKKSLIDTLPEMLVSALANHEDFVVTCETDAETKKKSLYVMTGDLITPDMLATFKQQIERKKEEGNTIITRDWK